MNKRKKVLLLLVVLIFSWVSIALAGTYSDEVFESVVVSLSSTKTATFTADTYLRQNSIKVIVVRLYRQYGNSWTFTGYLPVPTNEATNALYYGAIMDYSSYIGTGTYRILATFTADGHSISRYSNTITY